MSAAHDLFGDPDPDVEPAALTPAEAFNAHPPRLTPAEAERMIAQFDAEDAEKASRQPTREGRIAEVEELIARAEGYAKAGQSDLADHILAKVETLQDALEGEE